MRNFGNLDWMIQEEFYGDIKEDGNFIVKKRFVVNHCHQHVVHGKPILFGIKAMDAIGIEYNINEYKED